MPLLLMQPYCSVSAYNALLRGTRVVIGNAVVITSFYLYNTYRCLMHLVVIDACCISY